MALLNEEVIIKIIEQSNVSPPPGSVSTTSLPLTFLDVPWLLSHHIQRTYFYQFPHPTNHFLETLLPSLKHSLSLALQHFFPFAASLVCPPSPAKPHILFTEGDSVSLTVSESTADFNFLTADYPRPVRALDLYVPKLGPTRVDGDTRVDPLLALQFTVFPNSGICIGVRFNHVVTDGKALHHFLKSWALFFKTGGEDSALLDRELKLPSHDRAAVKDQYGLELEFLSQWRSLSLTLNHSNGEKQALDCGTNENFRATIVLRRDQIERLKRWLTNQLASDIDVDNSTPFHVSSYVVTCALIWVCLAQSEETNSTITIKDDEPYYFALIADCRSRLEFPLPTTYFGNCLLVRFTPVKRKELLEENGIVAAAKAIGKEVGELNKETVKEFENWEMKYKMVKESGWKHVTVEGSPKHGLYEVDFGWGRPKKSESTHFRDSTTFALVESRNEKGGVEVGLALSKARMSRFSAILDEILAKAA